MFNWNKVFCWNRNNGKTASDGIVLDDDGNVLARGSSRVV